MMDKHLKTIDIASKCWCPIGFQEQCIIHMLLISHKLIGQYYSFLQESFNNSCKPPAVPLFY